MESVLPQQKGRRKWSRARLIGSLLSLSLAILLSAVFFRERASSAPTAHPPEAQLASILPTADPLLLRRVAADRGYTAVEAAKSFGEDGLHVLETFGDTAAGFLEDNRPAFAALTRLCPSGSAGPVRGARRGGGAHDIDLGRA